MNLYLFSIFLRVCRVAAGYAAYLANQGGGPPQGHNRPISGIGSQNQFHGMPPISNLRGK